MRVSSLTFCWSWQTFSDLPQIRRKKSQRVTSLYLVSQKSYVSHKWFALTLKQHSASYFQWYALLQKTAFSTPANFCSMNVDITSVARKLQCYSNWNLRTIWLNNVNFCCRPWTFVWRRHIKTFHSSLVLTSLLSLYRLTELDEKLLVVS